LAPSYICPAVPFDLDRDFDEPFFVAVPDFPLPGLVFAAEAMAIDFLPVPVVALRGEVFFRDSFPPDRLPPPAAGRVLRAAEPLRVPDCLDFWATFVPPGAGGTGVPSR
jgi:hypothetical protein